MATVPVRVLARSIAVQSLGAAATFVTGMAIAWAMGPEAQGRYGLLRTAADLLLALALLGLPQGMVRAIHQRKASPALLAGASVRYGAGLLVVWIIAALMLPPQATPSWLDDAWALLALGLAVCGWLVQGLWRVLVLVVGDPLRFAWASILPALTLLGAVIVTLASDSQHFEWALGASGLASVFLAERQLRALRARPVWEQGGPAPLPALAAQSVLAMAPTVATALQPWLTLVLLQHAGAEREAIGWFVFASLVQQAFALPASFIAPFLLERVSREAAAARRYSVRPWLPVLVFAVAGALAVGLLLPWLVPLIFGPAYDAAVPACIWMAISGPFVVAGRFAAALLFGRGAFRAAALHALVRSLALPFALTLALAAMPGDRPAAAALAWLAIEVGAFALGAWLAFHYSREVV